MAEAFAHHRSHHAPAPSADYAGLVEPSNAEQADWPDCTRDYVAALSCEVERLKTRLERTRPEFDRDDLDGIACRDETIKLLDAKAMWLVLERDVAHAQGFREGLEAAYAKAKGTNADLHYDAGSAYRVMLRAIKAIERPADADA